MPVCRGQPNTLFSFGFFALHNAWPGTAAEGAHKEAPAAHKQTAHYLAWRDAVAPLMASPRVSHQYENVAPADAGWEMPR